jgi:hypothetical protein
MLFVKSGNRPTSPTHPAHGLVIGHDIEPIRQRYFLHLRPYISDQKFNDITDFMPADPPGVNLRIGVPPRDKSHLEINLCELRLSIPTTVFIPEAPGKLIVPVNSTGAHEKLFRLLRWLRERKKVGLLDFGLIWSPYGVGSCWNKKLASAFRGWFEENWGLNLEETWKGCRAGGPQWKIE